MHSCYGFFETRVSVRRVIFKIPHVLDPAPQPLVGRPGDQLLRCGAEALDGNQPFDAIRVCAGILHDDRSTQGVPDKINRPVPDNVDQGREVEYVLGDAVHGPGCPTAVAVAAEIRRNHPEVVAESVGNKIPAAGVISASVDKNQIGFMVVPPIPKVKFQAMRMVVLGDWLHR